MPMSALSLWGLICCAGAAGWIWYKSKPTGVPPQANPFLAALGVTAIGQVSLIHKDFDYCYGADLFEGLQRAFEPLGITLSVRGTSGMQSRNPNVHIPPALKDILSNPCALPTDCVGSHRVRTGYGIFRDYPLEAVYCYSGGLFPFEIVVHHSDRIHPMLSIECAFPADPAAPAFISEVVGHLETWMKERSFAKGKMITATFSYRSNLVPEEINFHPDSTRDVLLPPHLLSQLERELLIFIENREKFEALDIETSRGLLLCGLPGTGKTSTCDYLRRKLPDHTFILVSSAGFSNLSGMFELARRFAPAFLVFEDVDLIATTRDANHYRAILGDMLNQLDGLERRDRVHVLLSSNSWQFIESALADRPGRIDAVLFFDLPDENQRRALLQQFLAKVDLKVPTEDLIEWTRSFTPAQIKELVKKSVVRSIARGDGRSLNASDVQSALHDLRVDPLASAVQQRQEPRPQAPLKLTTIRPPDTGE